MLFATAYWLIRRNFKRLKAMRELEKRELIRQRENKELELRLMTTQHAFLQSQINPHLLFNTLNFVHSEVQQASPRASEAVIILAEMMRYSLTEAKADGKIELEKEVEQIGNLILLNQFRFDDRLSLDWKTSGDLEGLRCIPLLFIPFAENVFKYGDVQDAEHPAEIRFNVEGNTVVFQTRNRKKRTVHYTSHGIGIANVRERLNAAYPGQHLLEIHDSESIYSVTLRIEL